MNKETQEALAEIAGLKAGLKYEDHNLSANEQREARLVITIKELRQEVSRLQRLILKQESK